MASEAVLFEERPFLFAVIRFAERAIHFKVVAPAGEFHAVVAHLFDEREELREGEVGPLSGEESDGAWHNFGKFLSGDFARGDVEVNLCLRLEFLFFTVTMRGGFLRGDKKIKLRELRSEA